MTKFLLFALACTALGSDVNIGFDEMSSGEPFCCS
jgi:hypothetical protein